MCCVDTHSAACCSAHPVGTHGDKDAVLINVQAVRHQAAAVVAALALSSPPLLAVLFGERLEGVETFCQQLMLLAAPYTKRGPVPGAGGSIANSTGTGVLGALARHAWCLSGDTKFGVWHLCTLCEPDRPSISACQGQHHFEGAQVRCRLVCVVLQARLVEPLTARSSTA